MNFKNEKLIELRTKPSKTLIFSRLNPLNLRLYNDNPFPVLFKLKTTQPNIVASQPARGFIPSQSSIDCHLIPIEMKHGITLVIQYAQILNEYDEYSLQWKTLKSEQIVLTKLSCHFQDKQTNFLKPILLTFVSLTLLTSWLYLRR